MKIALFGPTGTAGRPILDQALAAGHEVTALVRDPAKLDLSHERLTIVRGGAQDAAVVGQVILRQELVINALSAGTLGPSTNLSDYTRLILATMKEYKVQRIVSLLASGMLTNEIPPQFKEINIEHQRVLNLLQDTDLDWIAVCPPYIVDTPLSGNYQIEVNAVPTGQSYRISRYDLAYFIINQLDWPNYRHQLIGIAN